VGNDEDESGKSEAPGKRALYIHVLPMILPVHVEPALASCLELTALILIVLPQGPFSLSERHCRQAAAPTFTQAVTLPG